MEKLPISSNDVSTLSEHKKRVQFRILWQSLFLPIIMFILSFVPVKYFPFLKARRIADQSSTFIESMGISWVLLILGGFALLLFTVLFFSYKVLSISKDLKQKTKCRETVQFIQLKMVDDYGTKHYELKFRSETSRESKLIFLEPHPFFKFIKPNSQLLVEYSEHARIPLNLFPFGTQ